MNTPTGTADFSRNPRAPESAPKPPWLKVRLPSGQEFFRVSDLLRKRGLHTICQSARCPNVAECWSRRTATFLILGDTCTRDCAFCAVRKGTPRPPRPEEPEEVAEAAVALGLAYAVVTSVTRDDLEDGGAAHFSRVVRAVRSRLPEAKIEVLIPDFKGDERALDIVLRAGPDILNHNLETTESLYPRIGRPAANYRRSLRLLEAAKRKGARTKSGLIIGLGESRAEILGAFADLRAAGCDLLTVGQYLRPAQGNAPVSKYYTPGEFDELRTAALEAGFLEAVAGPLVRSSYFADRLYGAVRERMIRA